MEKGIVLRIYPNQEQIAKINKNIGCVRFLWNQFLSMSILRYENNNQLKSLTQFDYNNLIPAMKIQYPFLKEVESSSLQAVSKDLTTAYTRFFSKKGRFPNYKSKKNPQNSYRSQRNGNNLEILDHNWLKIPKLGEIRYKGSIPTYTKINNVTIKKSSSNKYYAVLNISYENQVLDKTNKVIGLDMGVSDLVIGSDGFRKETIRFDKRLRKELHYWEKRLARRRLLALKEISSDKKLGLENPRTLEDFKNYQKAKVMVAKYHEKIRNQRKNYIHHITKELVTDYDLITVEDLKTLNLMKNPELSRAIANQSWRMIRTQLEYKCLMYGKQLVAVNPYKTSQLCSTCNHDSGKKPLEVREWKCPSCNNIHDRDINAAKNILNKGIIGLEQALVKS